MEVEKGVQVYNSDILRGEGVSGNAWTTWEGSICELSVSACATLPVPQGPAYHQGLLLAGCWCHHHHHYYSTAQGLVTAPSAFLSEENSNSDSDSD